MSGVPKYAGVDLAAAAVMLCVQAVEAAADAARRKRQAAEEAERQRNEQRMADLDRWRAEQEGKRAERQAEAESAAQARREEAQRALDKFRQAQDERAKAQAVEEVRTTLQGLEQQAAELREQAATVGGVDMSALTSAVSGARDAIARGDVDQAQQQIQAASDVAFRAQQAVAEAQALRAAHQVEAEKRLGDVEVQIAGLEADDLAARWCAPALVAARTRLNELKSQAATDPGAAASAADELAASFAGILAQARSAQELDERQRYVASGIAKVMADMGFVVGEPQREYADYPNSALVFTGAQVGGSGMVSVSVPAEGEVWYNVDGYPFRLETSSSGREVKSCDEAEQEILRMHSALKERFGIQMGDLSWEGKDPNRAIRYADDIPTSGSQQAGGSGRS